jgi:probable F420-dependent oxidoreductase
MHLGIANFNTKYGLAPAEIAAALEARGYESLWLPEHTHIPASRRTPFPRGGELPKPYYHTADPFVSLMAAAAATERLKLATGICLLIQHHPIGVAKTTATLDRLSGGRFIFGIGAGWNAEEMENHGTAFDQRFQVLDERLQAVKAIWTQEEASFHGDFVDFDPIISNPKPVQQPHPPIVYGGRTGRSRQRVVDHCDGWMPIDGYFGGDPGRLAEPLADLTRRAEAAGRDPATIEVSVYAFMVRTADDVLGYRDAGIDRLVLVCPSGRDEALGYIDAFAEVVPRVA